MKKGVTLIELLAAMTILVVVAAIVLPVVTRAKDRAGVATDISNLRQIGIASEIYRSDYDERNDGLLPLIIGGYLKDDRILRSPRDSSIEGASIRLARALEGMVPEWAAEITSVTYYSYREATILKWFYDQNLYDQPSAGWLINPVSFPIEIDNGQVLEGRYQRLLWDGSVQSKSISPVNGVNSDGYEYSIQPTYSLFCDPSEETKRQWYSGD